MPEAAWCMVYNVIWNNGMWSHTKSYANIIIKDIQEILFYGSIYIATIYARNTMFSAILRLFNETYFTSKKNIETKLCVICWPIMD